MNSFHYYTNKNTGISSQNWKEILKAIILNPKKTEVDAVNNNVLTFNNNYFVDELVVYSVTDGVNTINTKVQQIDNNNVLCKEDTSLLSPNSCNIFIASPNDWNLTEDGNNITLSNSYADITLSGNDSVSVKNKSNVGSFSAIGNNPSGPVWSLLFINGSVFFKADRGPGYTGCNTFFILNDVNSSFSINPSGSWYIPNNSLDINSIYKNSIRTTKPNLNGYSNNFFSKGNVNNGVNILLECTCNGLLMPDIRQITGYVNLSSDLKTDLIIETEHEIIFCLPGYDQGFGICASYEKDNLK